MDPQRLVQHIVERGVVVAELFSQRLLGLGLTEVGRRRARALPLLLWTCRGAVWSGKGGARRRGLDSVRWVPQHHAAILPHHQHPRHGLGGWCGPVPPLAPSRWRGVIIRNLHRSRPTTTDGDGCQRNRRHGGCCSSDHRRGRCLLLRLHGHGHTVRCLARRRRALCRPQRLRRALPRGHGRARP
jgi:hypothetical protein